jgi:hypothetical protein
MKNAEKKVFAVVPAKMNIIQKNKRLISIKTENAHAEKSV